MTRYEEFVKTTYQSPTQYDLNTDILTLLPIKNDYLIIVNLASACGLFDHVYDLNNINLKNNVHVIGQPSNDFDQEPIKDENILSFYNEKGIDFCILEKNTLFDKNKNKLYHLLMENSSQKPKWNFHKYVIDTKEQKLFSFCHLVDLDKILESVGI